MGAVSYSFSMDIETRPHNSQQLVLRIIAGGIVVLAAVVGVLWWLAQDAQSVRGTLQSIHSRVGFRLYYPAQLASGFRFNRETVSVTSEVVSYVITYDGKKTLIVSTQPKSAGFDESKFNPTSDFTTTIGHAYIADLPDRTTAAVVGEQSWVLINAPEKIAVDQLTTFINSLHPL